MASVEIYSSSKWLILPRVRQRRGLDLHYYPLISEATCQLNSTQFRIIDLRFGRNSTFTPHRLIPFPDWSIDWRFVRFIGKSCVRYVRVISEYRTRGTKKRVMELKSCMWKVIYCFKKNSRRNKFCRIRNTLDVMPLRAIKEH